MSIRSYGQAGASLTILLNRVNQRFPRMTLSIFSKNDVQNGLTSMRFSIWRIAPNISNVAWRPNFKHKNSWGTEHI